MSDDTVVISGRRYVYVTEENIERVNDLVAFMNDHEGEYYRWLRQWGESKFPTTVQQ